MTLTITKSGDTPTPNPNPDPTYPTALYLVGNVNSTAWSTSAGVSATGTNGVYTWDSVTIDASSADSAEGYFTLVTALGASWDEVNLSDRYGASTKDEAITSTATIVKYEANVSASGAYSWKAAAGTYKVVADLSTMTLTITKSGDTPTPNPNPDPTYPTALYLVGNVNSTAWSTSAGVSATGTNGVYTWDSVTIDASSADSAEGYFTLVTALGASWDEVNLSDRYGASTKDEAITSTATIVKYEANVSASGAYSWKAAAGTYKVVADLSTMTLTITKSGDTPTPDPGNYPEHIYMVGNVNGTSWATSTGLAPDTAVNGIYTWNSVNFGAASSDWPYGYFTFLTALDEIDGDWNGANQADRYGAPAADTEIVANSPSTVKLYAYMVDAMAAQSWKVTPGAYKTVLDLTAMTVTISLPTGIDEIAAEAADADVEYYNLQGVRVENPTPGIYIVRRAGKVTKEIVR